MVSEGANVLEDEDVVLAWPFDNLDFAFSVIKANPLLVAHYDKLFEWLDLKLLIRRLLLLLIAVVFVPLEIDTSVLEILEPISRVEECHFVQMWKHKDAAEDMVIVIVPRILISVLDHNIFGLNIYDLKLLLFQVSYSQIIVKDTEAKAVSTETLGQS